jgi:Divergent InlB B-repeat domain/Collagen triple helix repeat (20 copies)
MLQSSRKRLQRPIRFLKEPFGRAGLIVAVLALALGLTVAPAIATPTFEGTFGEGEVGGETTIAVDNSSSANAGDIYVGGGGGVLRYDPSTKTKVGEIAFGGGAPGECEGAIAVGTAWGVAVSSANGDVFFSNPFSGETVTGFTPAGKCIWQWKATVAGLTTGVAVDPGAGPEGRVYVVDWGKAGLVELNAATGAEEGVIGEGQLTNPLGDAVDTTTHDIFVITSEAGAEVVREYEANGTCANSCTPVSANKAGAAGVDPTNGHVFVTEHDFEATFDLAEYAPEGAGWKLIEGFGEGDFGGSQDLFGIAVSSTHKLYVAAASEISWWSLGAATPTQELKVSVTGTGEGEVTGGKIACKGVAGTDSGTCTAQEEEGTTVTLTATAEPGSTFAGWSGACSGTGTCEVTMSEAREVTAEFTANPLVALTITPAGGGTGSVECEVNKAGGFKACAPEYSEGSEVTLKGVAGAHSTFEGWSAGSGSASACAGTANCPFTLAEASGVTATFGVVTSSPLTVFVTGEGKVGSSPTGIEECGPLSGTCTAEFEGPVTLTATAEPGWTFVGWLGCKHVSATTCEVNVTAASEVTAVFLKEGIEGKEGKEGKEGPEGKQGKEGKEGKEGEEGEEGAKGATGTAGAAGKEGPAGKTGPAGAPGAQGPPGPEGKRGPAGKVVIVTCTKKGKKKRCTTKVVSGTVKFTAAGASVHALLSRHGKVYAAGVARVGHGRLSLRLQPLRKLRAGHYTLTLIAGSGRHETVRTESFTLS